MNEPLGQFSDKEFGFCSILFDKREELENVCLFASHTPLPLLPEYIYYYLGEIKKAGFSIVFISSSTMSEVDTKRLSAICSIVFEKENKGADFGAWCCVLKHLHYGVTYKTLYLCNDSVFGPLIPFDEINKKFQSIEDDILGITDSYQGGYHIQSYFIGLKESVLQSVEWKEFWSCMKFQKEKAQIITYHEIGLSKALLKGNMKYFIWSNWSNKIDYKTILLKVSESDVLRPKWLNRLLHEKKEIIYDINPNSFLWKELITTCRNPFIKRELFLYPNLFEEGELDNLWEEVLKKYSSYPTELIKHFLIDLLFNHRLKEHLLRHKKTKLQLASGVKKNVKSQGTEQTGNVKPLFSLDAIENLLPHSFAHLPYEYLRLCRELEHLKIKYNPIILSSDENNFPTMFIYLTDTIVELETPSLNKLKMILKRIINPIIIVPNKGLNIVLSSLLSLKNNSIIVENDFYNPAASKRVVDVFETILSAYEENEHLNLFERYTLSHVTNDALKGTNKSGFLEQQFDSSMNDSAVGFYTSNEDFQNYLAIKNKYSILYENTPLWYKRIGQIIKVFQGHKRLVIGFKDKLGKNVYEPTVEDITHWYYQQYEVLPEWYKKIGKKLTKKS
jgi:hypothetical protein